MFSLSGDWVFHRCKGQSIESEKESCGITVGKIALVVSQALIASAGVFLLVRGGTFSCAHITCGAVICGGAGVPEIITLVLVYKGRIKAEKEKLEIEKLKEEEKLEIEIEKLETKRLEKEKLKEEEKLEIEIEKLEKEELEMLKAEKEKLKAEKLETEKFIQALSAWTKQEIENGAPVIDVWEVCEEIIKFRQRPHKHALWLCDKKIKTLPDYIQHLTGLKKIDASNSQLTALPAWIGKLTDLKCLKFENNRLTTLPEELKNLKKLESCNFSGNRLTAFPDFLYELPNTCTIEMQKNEFEEDVFLAVQKKKTNSGEEIPNIQLGSYIPLAPACDEKSNQELMTELSSIAGISSIDLVVLKENRDVSAWLSRLFQDDLYSSGDAKEKVAKFICESIQQAESDAVFREGFIQCIQKATSSCGDRVVTSLLDVEIYHKIAVALTNNSLGELAYILGHGVRVLDECRKISTRLADEKEENGINEFANLYLDLNDSNIVFTEVQQFAENVTDKVVDRIELYLYLPMKFRECLSIPISNKSMKYSQFGELYSNDEISNVEMTLVMLLNDKQDYFSFLSKNTHWQKMLEKHPDTQDDYEKITENAHTALVGIGNDADGRKKCQQVQKDREDALLQLTSTVLEEEDDFFKKAKFLEKEDS